jgi:hybrid cluster-associated redox disulfide protein
MAIVINKDMIIGEIITIDSGIIPILLQSGMHCLGCPSAQGESLADATEVHGINADELVNQINEYLASK